MLQCCFGLTPDSAVVNVLLPVKNPTTPLNIVKMICTSNERIRMVPPAASMRRIHPIVEPVLAIDFSSNIYPRAIRNAGYCRLF
jgi:hypothetical protein